jgi:hypothetical protein
VVNVTAGISDDDTKAKSALETQVQQTIAAD